MTELSHCDKIYIGEGVLVELLTGGIGHRGNCIGGNVAVGLAQVGCSSYHLREKSSHQWLYLQSQAWSKSTSSMQSSLNGFLSEKTTTGPWLQLQCCCRIYTVVWSVTLKIKNYQQHFCFNAVQEEWTHICNDH